VLVAAQVDEVKLMQQPGLLLNQLQAPGQRLQNRSFLAAVAGQGQLFHHVVKVGDQPITEAMAMQAGQAMQHRNEPAHQIQGGLLNRQLGGARGGGHDISSKKSSAAIVEASCAGNHGSAQRAGPE
jgi:hypothetical protein